MDGDDLQRRLATATGPSFDLIRETVRHLYGQEEFGQMLLRQIDHAEDEDAPELLNGVALMLLPPGWDYDPSRRLHMRDGETFTYLRLGTNVGDPQTPLRRTGMVRVWNRATSAIAICEAILVAQKQELI